MQQIERKMKQLHGLRDVKSSGKPTNNESKYTPGYRSPQAKKTYSKKVQSLRLLGEFKKLFNE